MNTERMATEQAAAVGTRYPLLFTYRDTLFGTGVVLEVQAVNGRALCVKEAEDEYWVYGINPGGMAAHGNTADEAHAAFRRAFSHILIDHANEAQSFDDLRKAVEAFFAEVNPGYEAEWQEALLAVRRGDVVLEGVPMVPANSPRSISVTVKQVEHVTPRDNSASLQYLLAA
jgi:hypothetical protein